MTASAPDWFAALDRTWPPAATEPSGPFRLRDGQGGGKRVSAATLEAPFVPADIDRAAEAMRSHGRDPLFMVREGEEPLDRALAEKGYGVVDPTDILAAPAGPLADRDLPRLAALPAWPPIAIIDEIWEDGGVGPARRAIMARAKDPATALLGRRGDRPCGAAFVAVVDDVAMLHALTVRPDARRSGVATHLVVGAARWAAGHDAGWLSVAVVSVNTAAQALFAGLGFRRVTGYRYRTAPMGGAT